MSPNHYTELFFLDEATALSAGHRPCAQCMRDRYNEFRSYWANANADLVDSSCFNATQLDKILHSERISSDKQKSTYTEHLNALPVGSFILLDSDASPCLVLEEALLVWTPGGYTQQIEKPKAQQVTVLTPRSIVQMLKAGFRPHLHDSAAQLAIAKQLRLTATV